MAFEVATPASASPQRFANYAQTGEPILPHPAPDRILVIKQIAQDSRAVLVSFDVMQEAMSAKGDIERRLHALRSGVHGRIQGDDSPHVLEEERKLAAATAEILRLRELDSTRASKWKLAGALESRVTDFIRSGPPFGSVWCAHEDDQAPIVGDLARLIEKLHFDIREAHAKIKRVKAAPFPKSEALAVITKQLDGMAKLGEPYCDGAIELLSNIEWPTRSQVALVQNLPPELPAGAAAISQETDCLSLLIWACRDTILSKISKTFDQIEDPAAAVSSVDRKARLETAHAELMELERLDARLFWEARNRNMDHVLPRPDIDIACLLGLRLAPAPAPSATEKFIGKIRESMSLGLGGKGD